jgi:hypothetical protein
LFLFLHNTGNVKAVSDSVIVSSGYSNSVINANEPHTYYSGQTGVELNRMKITAPQSNLKPVSSGSMTFHSNILNPYIKNFKVVDLSNNQVLASMPSFNANVVDVIAVLIINPGETKELLLLGDIDYNVPSGTQFSVDMNHPNNLPFAEYDSGKPVSVSGKTFSRIIVVNPYPAIKELGESITKDKIEILWSTESANDDCTVIYSTKDSNLDDDTLVSGRDSEDYIFGSIFANSTGSNYSLTLRNQGSEAKFFQGKRAFYKVICYNKNRDRSVSLAHSFVLPGASSYEGISGLNIKNITDNSATVEWKSFRADISHILYGTENSLNGMNRVAKNNFLTNDHNLTLSGLLPNTPYYFHVLSNNDTTLAIASNVYNFTTKASLSNSVTKLGDGTYDLKEGDKVKLDNDLIVVPVYFTSGSDNFEFSNVKFDVYLGATKLTTTDFTRVGWNTKNVEAVATFYDNFNVKYNFKVYVEQLGRSNGVWNSKITFKSGDTIRQENIEIVKPEPIKPINQITNINEASQSLAQGNVNELLAQINQLRNQLREQETQIRYLKNLTSELSKISSTMQTAVNTFITYGVDDNTKRLGEGERAAVINSYKSAYGKLPNSESELNDVIKIANGRWPSATNTNSENKAKTEFRNIYKREANMNNANDNAAVTIMAYGLRQRAENRNLNSESAGLKIFRGIYGRMPQNTQDWNILQAITYSGATR